MRRHALVSLRDGSAFPRLQVASSGGRTLLAWESDSPSWAKLDYQGENRIWIDRNEFREGCTELVDRVVRRLLSCGIERTLLQEEWAAIQAADQDESRFCRTAAGLGWDPYALDDPQRDAVLRLEDVLDAAIIEEAVPVLDVGQLSAQATAIAMVLEPASGTGLPLRHVRDACAQPMTGNGGSPWASGYALARNVSVLCAEEGTRQHRRFHFCRGLAEVLTSPGLPALLTQARSDRQQRNRAFAAEFLAPSAALRARVPGRVLDEEYVDDLAADFGVPPWLIVHQLQNHRIARVWKS